MNIYIFYRGSNIWNKRFISKQERNVSCCLDPISRSVITNILRSDTKYLFWVIITTFAIGNRFKGIIENTWSATRHKKRS